MSFLRISTGNFGTFELNVLSFNSPIFGTIIPVQTKTIAQFFPVKAQQPEIQFDVMFRNEWDYQRFQQYVRAHQRNALYALTPEVRLHWPERGITNWTGVIKEFRAGGMRRNYTPRATFIVYLIDSMVSMKTYFASSSVPFFNVVGNVIDLSSALLRQPVMFNNFSRYSGR